MNYRSSPLPFQELQANLERQMAEYLSAQGDRLRAARKVLGISQEDAAHLIGVSFKTYNSWENGHSEPRDKNWRRIEEELKVRAD